MSDNKDQFWMYDPTILYKENRYRKFFPEWKMSIVEKLNAATRFLFYTQIIFILMSEDSKLPIALIGLMVLLYKINESIIITEKFDGEDDSRESEFNMDEELIDYSPVGVCREPTVDNPYANDTYLDISGDKEAPKPCDLDENNNNKDKLENVDGDPTLFNDLSSLHLVRTMDRDHYPRVPFINDQKGFALWIYGKNKEYDNGYITDKRAGIKSSC